MKIRIPAVTVLAPRNVVFNFLADVESLPKWATEFCERVYISGGRWLALTSQGELFIEIEADNRTGVIDMRVGPTQEEMNLFPMRVMALPSGETMVSFTFCQPPGLPDDLYERQYESLMIEMRGLTQRFGGGQLHASTAEPTVALAG